MNSPIDNLLGSIPDANSLFKTWTDEEKELKEKVIFAELSRFKQSIENNKEKKFPFTYHSELSYDTQLLLTKKGYVIKKIKTNCYSIGYQTLR